MTISYCGKAVQMTICLALTLASAKLAWAESAVPTAIENGTVAVPFSGKAPMCSNENTDRPAGLKASLKPRSQKEIDIFYPPESQQAGEKGEAQYAVLIGTKGEVVDAEVFRSSGSKRLDETGSENIKAYWRFDPARRDGKPVECGVILPISWPYVPPRNYSSSNIDINAADDAPKYTAPHVRPDSYPYTARNLGQQGTVITEITVTTEGKAIACKVTSSSGYQRLDAAACSLLAECQFTPKMEDAKPIEWIGPYTVAFTLVP